MRMLDVIPKALKAMIPQASRSGQPDPAILLKRLCLRLPQELALWTILIVLLVLVWGTLFQLGYLTLGE